MEALRLHHSRDDEQRFDLKAERRVLQREVGPTDVDFEQRARDKHEKQRKALVSKLIHAERMRRAQAMLATVQRAFAEAKCPVRVDVDWACPAVDPDAVNERIRLDRRRHNMPFVVKKAPKKQHRAGKEPRPRQSRIVEGKTVRYEQEMVTVIIVSPLLWARHAWSEWSYTIADRRIVFTWVELPPRDAEFRQSYPDDWTWFPQLRTESNRAKQTVVTWAEEIDCVSYFASDRTAEALKASALQQTVLHARKNARRRVHTEEDSDADDEE